DPARDETLVDEELRGRRGRHGGRLLGRSDGGGGHGGWYRSATRGIRRSDDSPAAQGGDQPTTTRPYAVPSPSRHPVCQVTFIWSRYSPAREGAMITIRPFDATCHDAVFGVALLEGSCEKSTVDHGTVPAVRSVSVIPFPTSTSFPSRTSSTAVSSSVSPTNPGMASSAS